MKPPGSRVIAEKSENKRDHGIDQKQGESAEVCANCCQIAEVYANLCPSTRKPRVDGARLGCLGMSPLKPTPIWDGYRRGRGTS
jgi:hypothetical protein